MSHASHAAPPSFWLRLEWRLLVRIEGWIFSHHRRGMVLSRLATVLDRIYERQKHLPIETVAQQTCRQGRRGHRARMEFAGRSIEYL